MSELIRLLVLALKTIAAAAGFTVILLLVLGAGSSVIHIVFLAVGLMALAIAVMVDRK